MNALFRLGCNQMDRNYRHEARSAWCLYIHLVVQLGYSYGLSKFSDIQLLCVVNNESDVTIGHCRIPTFYWVKSVSLPLYDWAG